MSRIITFVKDSVEEVRTKVSWPKYSELQGSATLVLVASLIFALLVGLVDFGFENAMKLFYQSFIK
jgi:preprotein translocase subunit SecE